MLIDKNKVKILLPYILLIVTSITVMGDIFSKGYLTNSDNIAHLLEAEYLKENLLPEGKIAGWYPYVFAGIPLHIYTPLLGYWIIILLSLIPGISINLAYKIIVLLSFVGPSLVIFYLMRKKVGKFAAFIPAFALLFQHEYQSFIITGMWNSGLAIILLFVLYIYLEYNKEKFNIKNALISGLIIALTILAHSFIAIASIIITVNFFVIRILKKENITRSLYLILTIALTAILLSLFYILPIIETSNWPLKGTSYGLGDTIKEVLITETGMFLSLKHSQIPITGIMAGEIKRNITPLIKSIFYNIPMLIFSLFGIIGFIFYIKNRKGEKEHFLYDCTALNIFIMLVLGSGFWYLSPQLKNIPILGTLLPYRFVYIARFMLAIFSAYGIVKIIKKQDILKYTKIILIAVLTIPIVLAFNNYKLNEKLTETTFETEVYYEALDLFEWLKNNVNPNDTRIFDQNTYVNIRDGSIAKQNLILALGPKHTGIQFLTSWVTSIYPTETYLITENKHLLNKTVKEASEEEIVFFLKKYNAKYIITSEKILEEKIIASDRFKENYRSKHFRVFELLDYKPTWIESKNPFNYGIHFKNEDEIEININNQYKDNDATVKIAYHPYWQAYIKETNEEIELEKDIYGLISVKLPKGNYKLILKFGKNLRAYNIIQIPLLMIFIIILIVVKRKAY